MPTLLIASSPVEIEAKADEAALPPAAHGPASRLFHILTDRLMQAAIALGLPHHDWPNHRFYFGTPHNMGRLLNGLRNRADLLDVTDGVPSPPSAPTGLFVRQSDGEWLGVLVGHDNHDGLPGPN